MKFASKYTTITPIQIQTIKQARESILHHNNKTWSKKTGLFDVTMGSYDGAQVTDLVGLFILHKLKQEIPQINFRLYRDDGIGIHRRIPNTQINKSVEKIKNIFETLGLKITIKPNLTKVDFLDVTFNLETESFQPFRKPNDTPTYINKDSNHPSHIKKNLPIAINKRLSEISSNEHLFNDNKQPYEDALRKSGLKNNLKFQNHQNNGRKRNRSRKQIWFTPPYNATLKTNIGKPL